MPAATAPDLVIGMPGNSGAATLGHHHQPADAVRHPSDQRRKAAYLDVIAQSQSNDEFWYLCVPNDLAGQLESCGSTGFRETEITIDGIPAGVAPVYPWIYTGGIDPYLWEPIPGVQTLNFKPYPRRSHALRRRSLEWQAAHRRHQRLQRQQLLLRHRQPAHLHRQERKEDHG